VFTVIFLFIFLFFEHLWVSCFTGVSPVVAATADSTYPFSSISFHRASGFPIRWLLSSRGCRYSLGYVTSCVPSRTLTGSRSSVIALLQRMYMYACSLSVSTLCARGYVLGHCVKIIETYMRLLDTLSKDKLEPFACIYNCPGYH